MNGQTAHLFRDSKGWFLIVSTSAKPVGDQYRLQTKREAKSLAASLGAKPWNF